MPPISLPARRSVLEQIGLRLLAMIKDWVTFALAASLAFELRFDGALPPRYFQPLWIALAIWPVAKTIMFTVTAVNRGKWQYTSVYDAERIAIANTAGSVLGGLGIVVTLGPWGIPRSIYILEWIISCFLVLGGRLVVRAMATAKNTRWADGEGTRTLIYGAGAAGLQLLWELRQNRALMCDVVGLIDDDPSKFGLILDGKRVLGTGEKLEDLARKHAIKKVLIAIPSRNRTANGPHSEIGLGCGRRVQDGSESRRSDPRQEIGRTDPQYCS